LTAHVGPQRHDGHVQTDVGNRAVILHQEAQARIAAKAKADADANRSVPPTSEEVDQWHASKQAHTPEVARAYEQAATWFQKQPGFVFPVDGRQLTGPEVAWRIREGAPLEPFLRVQSKGIWIAPRDRRR
jgi:hypothetical protein